MLISLNGRSLITLRAVFVIGIDCWRQGRGRAPSHFPLTFLHLSYLSMVFKVKTDITKHKTKLPTLLLQNK